MYVTQKAGNRWLETGNWEREAGRRKKQYTGRRGIEHEAERNREGGAGGRMQ
jgi:hypothetical protein